MNQIIDILAISLAFLALSIMIGGVMFFTYQRKKYLLVIYEGLMNLLSKEANVDLNLLQSFFGSMGRTANSSYSIKITLEAFISYLITSTDQNVDFYIKYQTLLRQLLDEAKNKEPFEACPDPERILLEYLSDLNKEGLRETVSSKLKELGDQVAIRYSEYQKVDRNNKWMVRITVGSAIIGLLSLIFALITLFK